MTRLLVNDARTQIPGTRTFWHDLEDWFRCTFVGAPFDALVETADKVAAAAPPSLIIRNATYFGPLESSKTAPTIALVQDIITEGPLRDMQEAVIKSAQRVVFNSEYTAAKYPRNLADPLGVKQTVIPLPVDFALFEPGNAMGWQQALGLPDRCTLWIGAQSEVKGWDVFLNVVRLNPDLNFVAVFKDAIPEVFPPNLRCYARCSHDELLGVIRACRAGLCTSRMESQHLAGIEMGACGLPMVAPPVGIYAEPGFPGAQVTGGNFALALRGVLGRDWSDVGVRGFWRERFDVAVVKALWTELIGEVEV